MPAGGDKLLITDLSAVTSGSITKPILRLVQASGQTIAHNSNVPLLFASETIDTDNFFNAGTSQSRVTPTKAGYYRCHGSLFMATSLTYLNVSVFFRKNGTTTLAPGGRVGGLALQGAPASAPVSQFAAVDCEVLIDCNGTSDYLELMAFQTNTGSAAQNTNANAQYSSALEMEFVRGL
jgi:hypothetical protein